MLDEIQTCSDGVIVDLTPPLPGHVWIGIDPKKKYQVRAFNVETEVQKCMDKHRTLTKLFTNVFDDLKKQLLCLQPSNMITVLIKAGFFLLFVVYPFISDLSIYIRNIYFLSITGK